MTTAIDTFLESTTTRFNAYLIARGLFASLFVVSGVNKAASFSGVSAWMAASGVPLPDLVLTATLLLEIGGGTALLVGWNARWLALAFAGFVVLASVTFHQFWAVDAAAFENELNHFLKNVAILGGALMIYSAETTRALR
jgi:putative oxidoreductase